MREVYKERGGSYTARRKGRRTAGVDTARLSTVRRRRIQRRRIAGVALLALLLVAVISLIDYLLVVDEGEISPGVYVGELYVGGQSTDQAHGAIESQASTAFEEITFTGADEELSVSGADLGIELDAASTAEEAYSVRRRGGTVQHLADFLGSYLLGIQIDADIEYSEDAVRGALEDLPAVDQEETLANLDQALASLSGEVPLAEGSSSAPAASEEEAATPKPTVLLGEFYTDYAWDPDEGRQANLRLASAAIDNTLLAPGEEFSALEVLSPLDYEPAKVFADGGVDYEVGGGLCQVSSTLYMAAHYAGLEITERNPHYAELPYIRPGFDATVWFGENGWGALDMKFKNNTDGYILIRQFVNEDGFMVAEIYGEEPADKVVTMDSEKIREDLEKGIEWATYKKVTDENGEVIFDDVLYETTYSYNPPTPPELKHETNEPRTSGWVDPNNTTGWNDKD